MMELLHKGFGDQNGEYWLGLDVVRKLTESSRQELLVQLWDDDGNSVHARYGQFKLSNGSDSDQIFTNSTESSNKRH